MKSPSRPRSSLTLVILCVASCWAAPGFAQKSKDWPKPKNAEAKAAATGQPKVAVNVNVQVNVATQITIGGSSPPAHGEKAAGSAKELPVQSQRPAPQGPPRESETRQVSGAPAKPAPAPDNKPSRNPVAKGQAVSSPREEPAGDDLFELHVRLRRTTGGVDVLLAGTVQTPQQATAAAARIHQVKEQGMLGLLVLPLIIKTDPEMHQALRSAWGSIKADARGSRLALTASIPNEALQAAAKLAEAARQFANDLLGRK